MRAIGLASASLVMITLMVSDADAASNRWCAVSPKRSENCGYATLDQCRNYLDRYRSGLWTGAAKSLLAVSLAKQKRWEEAIQAIDDTEEDSLEFSHHQVLIARWRRMLAQQSAE